MADDLRHLRKEAEKEHLSAEEKRRRASVERQRAAQYSNDENAGGRVAFHEAQAMKLEQDAQELDSNAAEKEQAQQVIQQEVQDLEDQKTKLIQDHDRAIAQIDKEIDRKRGGMLL